MSRCSATPGPTWAVSPSIACFPQITRSNSPSFKIASANVYEVASVSAPAKALSDRRMASSAPRARVSRSAASACGGPIEMQVTRPPCSSRICRACSTAYMSKGFTMDDTPSRTNVLVLRSILTSVVSGTCFTRTTKFIYFSRPP